MKDIQKNSPPSEDAPIVKRNCIVAAKVTATQKKRIEHTARKCGMTVSDFILARCYGYEPTIRLTQEELDSLRGMIGYRNDIIGYTNALHGMKADARRQMFSDLPFMYGWTKQLGIEYQQCHEIIERLKAPNPVPKDNSRTKSKPSNNGRKS